ncbi:MAG: hypothetical protein KGM16_15180 [Bacteroidota bacterium]|nr:hypothetical protein [Bacteroidota bacterium]
MIKFLFAISSLSISCNNTMDSNQIKQVVIHYVSRDIETFYDVTCANFEDFFGNKYRTKKITEKNQLIVFQKIMNNHQNSSFKNIDVRAKIYIYCYNKKVSVLCVDKFGNIELDNKLMGKNDKLFNFLEKNCEDFK